MRLLIISGTSGAGKSIALHALEDLGYYCIDNLPIGLLPAVAQEMTGNHRQSLNHTAVGIDARNPRASLEALPATLEALSRENIECEILFLDADDLTLIKRFSETRRPHPLSDQSDLSLEEAIAAERLLLKPLSHRADMQVDTSRTNVHQLRDLIQAQVGRSGEERPEMSIQLLSFGFKHGVPAEADFVFDVRCLPNPHWDPGLRSYTGQDPPVARFLQSQPAATQMLSAIGGFLDQWLPCFQADKRSYMTVAIGCTGGQHRSVYFVEQLTAHLQQHYPRVVGRHRELSG